MKISEQLVLVTGGARGLGKYIVQAAAQEGASVVVNYHESEQAAKALVKTLGDKALAVKADVTDKEQVQAMFADSQRHFGRSIDAVVNNALINFQFNGDARSSFKDMPWEALNQQLEGAVKGALNTTQAALPEMAAQHFGRIINIGTNLFQNPIVPYHDYTTAKAALLALTRTAAQELGPDGITVNMISGGLLRTTDASAVTPEFVFDLIANQTPLREVTTPAQFADTVLFFLSPWSRAVTGQNLIVDGGLVKN